VSGVVPREGGGWTEYVAGCSDCSFRQELNGWECCGHPIGDGRDLEAVTTEPQSWCPLRTGPVTVELDEGAK
jgi:hypothetical protein